MSQEYRQIGIRSHGKGIFHKPAVTGNALGNKRVFWITPNALVLNIVFAWEQAVAVTSEIERGMIASHRFPMYLPRQGLCDVEFLQQFFYTQRGKDMLALASPGGAGRNKTLGQKEFENLRIALPIRAEQSRITSLLTAWHKAIAVTERLVTNFQLQKKALVASLLTGKRRVPGDTAVWKTVRLSNFCEVRRGASPRPINDPKWFAPIGRGWVRIADVSANTGRTLQSASQYLSEEGVARSVKVDPGDLIMSICASIGVPKLIGIPACVHDGFVIFRNCSAALSLDFLYYYLEFIAPKLANSGQPGTQKNLNTSIVEAIEVPAIPVKDQEAIATILLTADDELWNAQAQLAKLKQQRNALLQTLVTGQRRVPIEQGFEEAAE